MRLSIRTRFFLLLALLLLFPFLLYRLALDFNRQLLEQQIIRQSQTVQSLALILATRPDLWSLQIFQGAPSRHLQHLDLSRATLWIVNRQGTTTYVVGQLADEPAEQAFLQAPFEWIGRNTIRLIHNLFPHTLPYLIPYESQPERSLIEQALQGATAQRFRFDASGNPVTLMSATPLYLHDRLQGAIVLEQRVESLFGPRLRNFYHVVGIGTVIILLLMGAFGIYAMTLSSRISRLQQDVARAFDPQRHRLHPFRDTNLPGWRQDEVDQLRHQVHTLLQEIHNYEAYLRQLPKALRHELHNPLNRLNLSLQRLEQTEQLQPHLQQAQRGARQLEHILHALSEASSIEQSIEQNQPERYRLDEMLPAYLEAQKARYGEALTTQIQLQSPTIVCGDGFLLEQALDKLIENGLDFSLDGRVGVQARNEGGYAKIEVRNRGRLPENLKAEQLFAGMTSVRPPSQTKNQDSKPHLGLGLYIARLITEFHGGEIHVRQDRDDVVFTLLLPQAG